MKDGFIKAAAGTINVKVADTLNNTEEIIKTVSEAKKLGVKLLILPELCVTGYTCSDLFFTDTLLDSALNSVFEIKKRTENAECIFAVGCPLKFFGKLFNCAVVFYRGEVLGIVPKCAIPNYGEFYEIRQFSSGNILNGNVMQVQIGEKSVPFGMNLIFRCSDFPDFSFGIEICEDLWTSDPPSRKLAQKGAMIIANLSASDEVIGKEEYRRLLVNSTSARLISGYIYANASPTESTQDMVFSSHHILSENGSLLKENKPFEESGITVTEFDVKKLSHERHRCTTFETAADGFEVLFSMKPTETVLTRYYDKNPFVPPVDEQIKMRAESILKIQSYGLKKRLEHTYAKTAVIGISGGLDSTLALLVTVRAFDLMKKDRKEIICITMPCFGTTKRTKSNAVKLCEELGVTIKQINITDAVKQHFKDIEQDETNLDVTYENSQARERTQVLMDIANKTGGIVIGTGDLSELALGWATYNGDHMSMYGVNISVPKTLVRYIIKYESEFAEKRLSEVLTDILNTPVSPELLPASENGEISQKTEDLVGPYELHDFFLYHFMRTGSSPKKIYRLAKYVFEGIYSDQTILKWLKVFFRRFFVSQFKRSCMPDGPKVGSVTLSPRGDFRMPSDASYQIWLKEIDSLN